jgi:hypothetical protein
LEAKEQNEKTAGFQETLIKKVGSPIYTLEIDALFPLLN